MKKIAERKQPEMDRDHLAATERKRAEEALQRSEALYRLVVENINDIVWTFDLSSMTYTFISPSVQRILGYADEPMVKNLDAIFTPETKQRVLKAFGEFIESNAEGDILVMNAEHRQKDGHLIWMEISASPLKDDLGNIVGFLGTTRDITERKRAEEEKAKLEAQLQQAQKMESVGRLAGGVAHDFNNMLGVILGHAEMALEQVDPAQPLHADLQEIRKAAERSADLTRQLLAFARKQTVAPKVLDLNETVAGHAQDAAAADRRGHRSRLAAGSGSVAGQDGPVPDRPDPGQPVRQRPGRHRRRRQDHHRDGKQHLRRGLLRRSRGLCPGRVCAAGRERQRLRHGQGDLAHIFEPFFTTKEIGKGTGLGLATVYGIVKQNNGFINVYSEPGQGTTFTIYLPRHAGKAAQARTEGAAEPAARGHETILLVEDEPAILKLTTTMLEQQGYTVLAAGTPGEAIRLAEEHAGEIHLLMTDVVMPEMNGRDLAKNLLSLYPNLKRLFMSGYTADVIAHHGVLDEGVHFIQKPFSMKDLAAKVREALGE